MLLLMLYVHLMKDFTIMETLLANLAYEKLCAKAAGLLNIIKLIMVNFLTKNSLPPAIISHHQSKTETNS